MEKNTIVRCEMHNKKIQTSTSTEENIKHHLLSNLIHNFCKFAQAGKNLCKVKFR